MSLITSKHLVVVAVLTVVCFGAAAVYVWKGEQTGEINLADIKNNPGNYLGTRQATFVIVRVAPITITDWYNNIENGYSVMIRDSYNHESSFYIRQGNYQMYASLENKMGSFKIIGREGPYRDSHVALAPNLLASKPYRNYLGAWSVHIYLT